MAAPSYVVQADLDRDAGGVFESDWTSKCMEANIHRGRSLALDEQGPSTLELVLNNADGRFSKERGTLSGLDYDTRVQVRETTNGSYRFTGYIIDFDCDPHSEQQTAVITCVDLLGISEAINVSMGNVLDRTTDLVLNRVLDLMEAGEIISNPGAETDTTNWAAMGSATVTRETTTADIFEGDASVKADTDGAATGEGVAYNLKAEELTDATAAWMYGVFVKGPNGATLKLSVWGDVTGEFIGSIQNITCDGAWHYYRGGTLTYDPTDSQIEFRVQTRSSAQDINFYVDSLHFVPYANRIDRSLDTGLTTLNRVAFGEERADVALRKVVDSEPGLMWVDGQGQFVFKNRNSQFGNATANFGFESIGGSTRTIAADTKRASKFTLSQVGYVESVTAYCYAGAGTVNVKAVIYSDDSGPDVLKWVSDEVSIDTTPAWETFTLTYPLYLPAGDYWIGLIAENNAVMKFDTVSNLGEWNADTYSDAPASPFGASTTVNEKYSIYASYRYANPELNWADDGANKQYQSLKVHQSADERIRFVRIRSGGPFSAGTEIVRFWEYEPLPITVLARVPPSTNYTRIVFFEAPRGMRSLTLTCSGTDADHKAFIAVAGGGVMEIVLRNYTLTNWSITELHITGILDIEPTEESIYEHEETSASPYVYRALEIEMPFLGAAEDEPVIRGEAARLGKYVSGTLLADVGVIPQTDASLTEILALELRDCVTLQSDTQAQNLGFDRECWVEGISEKITWGKGLGSVEFVFSVEAI